MKFIEILSLCTAAAAAPLADVDGKASATLSSVTPSMSTVPNIPIPHGLLVKVDVIAKAEKIISEAHTLGHTKGHEGVSAPHGKSVWVDIDAEIKAIINILDKTGENSKQNGELLKDEQHRISVVVAKLNEKLDLEHQLKSLHAGEKHANATLTHQVSSIEVEIKNVLSKLQKTNVQGDAVIVHAKVNLLVELLSLLILKVEAEIKSGAIHNRGVHADVEVHELTLKLAKLLTIKAGINTGNLKSTNASANVDIEIHSVLVKVLGLLRVEANGNAKAVVSHNHTISGGVSSEDSKIELLGGLLKVLAKADVDIKAKVDADIHAKA
ncbi:hypothetical protein J3458_008792 [Metarhizium acridum]|uniref:Uncharacterized protein n=1 Tax=Metarhizium acridum (strain CQMa 102) TaxID=655827 RepID=E9DY09_METAQ|nr:uncharacterized protein MAC_02507 [Metarhizium acridum CQMa 102]EFY91344.1 hypothetical protein MAC_02507 [Metarhizium acridum CQMa 102]KAG8414892.1 hypothetical protein J3458_008792 [Metarhizium acridum]